MTAGIMGAMTQDAVFSAAAAPRTAVPTRTLAYTDLDSGANMGGGASGSASSPLLVALLLLLLHAAPLIAAAPVAGGAAAAAPLRARQELRQLSTSAKTDLISTIWTMKNTSTAVGLRRYGDAFRTYDYFTMKHAVAVNDKRGDQGPSDCEPFCQGPFHGRFWLNFGSYTFQVMLWCFGLNPLTGLHCSALWSLLHDVPPRIYAGV